jgi:hypothetical protein
MAGLLGFTLVYFRAGVGFREVFVSTIEKGKARLFIQMEPDAKEIFRIMR